VSIGSILWHLYPNNVTIYFDVLPIAIFSWTFAYYLMLKITQNKKYSIIGIGMLLGYISFCSWILRSYFYTEFINGAYEYLSLILLFIVALIYWYFKKLYFFKALLILFILFTVSLFFRQIDVIACNYRIRGTHFIWHIINAITMYLVVKLFIK
jgi:hypothetical protein